MLAAAAAMLAAPHESAAAISQTQNNPAAGTEILSGTKGSGEFTCAATAGQRFGDYELLEEIGRGGMGVVHKARQLSLGRMVAVKLLPFSATTNPDFVKRFRTEASAAASLQHPTIVAIHEVGVHQGQHYFAMDLVEGRSLADVVAAGPLSAKRAAHYVKLVAEAIEYAHQRGILHRDLKPSNILLDPFDQPRVTDFGLAKQLEGDSSLTLTGQVLGSPSYMPPEQADAGRGNVGRHSDVYALGATLYHLVTGRAPFASATVAETLRQLQTEEPVSPQLLNPTVPRDLATICLKCLEKAPQKRYATAQSLADELGRFLNAEPIQARPVGFVGKTWRWCRRKPALAAALAGLVAVLAAGFFAVLSQWQRAERHARNERREHQMADSRLYDALVREARAVRSARRTGYREEVFSLLQQARDLPVPQQDLAELRREAVACLGDFVGLRPITYTDFPSNTYVLVTHIAPSGESAAASLSDGSLLIRRLPSGEILARLRTGTNPAPSHCFNVTGGQLASVHWPSGTAPLRERIRQSVVCVWARSADGSWHNVEQTPLPGAYECLAARDGVYVAVDEPQGAALRLVDLKTKSTVQRVPLPSARRTPAMVGLSPDGRWLVTESVESPGGTTSMLEVWDWSSHAQLLRLEPRVSRVNTIAFSADSRFLICSSPDAAVLFETDRFQRVNEFREFFMWMTRPSISPDGSMIALPIWQQRRIRLWDRLKNEAVAVWDEPAAAAGAKFAPDGSFLLTLGGRHARLLRLDLATEVLRFSGHAGGVPGACFTPDGSRLASVGNDRTIRVWDATLRRVVWARQELPGPGQCVAFSPEGRWLITTDTRTHRVCLWDGLSGERLSEQWLDLVDVGERTTMSARFSPDGAWFAIARSGAGDESDGITLWNLKPGPPEGGGRGPVPNLVRSLPGRFLSLVFAPDAPVMAFMDDLHRQAFVWDLNGTNHPTRVATNVCWDSQSLAFLPGGRQLLVLDAQRTVRTIEIATGAELAAWSTLDARDSRPPGGQANLCLSPDGTKLAVTSASSLGVDIWNPSNGRLLYALPEEAGTVYWLDWHPDGQRLAVSRSAGDIAVWNLAEIERIVTRLGLNESEIFPDARTASRR
jgi:WD40 repeat protein